MLGFPKYSRFLGYRLAVAYDSASFAAMHFRPTITKKTNYQVANIQRSMEAFAACFQYSRCLLFVGQCPYWFGAFSRLIRMEQYAMGGNPKWE